MESTPTTSFSDLFASQFTESLSRYKRHPETSSSSDSESSESAESSDASSSDEEGPEYVSTGQAKDWKTEVGKQLQRDLEVAMLVNSKDEERQIHREIGVYRKFIELGYFEALEHFPETTVDLIRKEISEAANDSSQLSCLKNIDGFSSDRPSSPLSSEFASILGSSPPKKLKVLSQPERLAKAIAAVRGGASIREAATTYAVNRQTVKNNLLGRRTTSEYREDRLLLTPAEEAALLRFVDQFVALGFPPRIAMLEEKAMLLLRERGIDHTPGNNWARRFLTRHPQYVSKFPRNLDQERHWNSEVTVIRNWFDLYDRVCLQYGIANGDIYNMDEKGYMMGVAEGAGR